MASVCLHCVLALPADFRHADLLDFHRRDTQALAERVAGDTLHKGLFWEGQPACLTVRLGACQATVELAVDGPAAAGAQAEAILARRVRYLLGLTQPVAAFEAGYRDHPELGPLIARRPGLRVPQAASPFEALSWAVTGQQISVHAALALRRKLVQAAGRPHSGGLWCYPEAPQVAALEEDALRRAGFSQAKARTLLALSHSVMAGDLPLDAWREEVPLDTLGRRLLAMRGIGPWTLNYTLLRGFAWLDGSLHGDVAVRRQLQRLLGVEAAVGEAAAQAWLAQFSPWRALVAAHLWASARDGAGGPAPAP